MLWFTRAASWAAVINVLATSLGYYWPALRDGGPRATAITLIIIVIAAINIRGIKPSSIVVNVLTVGKLVPLLVFIAAGLFALDPSRLAIDEPLTLGGAAASGLLLIFGFGGYEVVPVVAGEAKDPRRAVPFALIVTIAAVAAIMTLVQIVVMGTLPDPPASSTPVVSAAAIFLGAAGAALMIFGATMSTSGNNMGQALSGTRNLFALAEHGDLPAFFGRVHPRFRTPVTAVLVTAAVSLALALSGRFAALAAVSAVSRLIVYVFTCAATIRLRHPRFAATVPPAMFTLPFGPLIPALAIMTALAILAGATPQQRRSGALALWPARRSTLLRDCSPQPAALGGSGDSLMRHLVAALVLVVSSAVAAAAEPVIFLVRHAERADAGWPPPRWPGPIRTCQAAGIARANALAAMLKDARITAVVTTDTSAPARPASPPPRPPACR